MFKYGINLLFITLTEVIICIFLTQLIYDRTVNVFANMHWAVIIIIIIELIISIYFIYEGYLEDHK